MTRRTYFGLLATGAAPLAYAANDAADVTRFGIKADGKTDDTAAIQKAMDTAATLGETVRLPAGKYLVAGSLRIPPGVSLEGVHDAQQWAEPLTGTVILATGGRDKEDGPALFEMGSSTVVRGLTVYYPEQKVTDIKPYSWTFHLKGDDNTVENVTLINSYNGIRIGPEANVRHRIRSVYGCVLRRGILVDGCSDIGRIENVQFHCHWWSAGSGRGLEDGPRIHVEELRGVHLRPHRLGVRHQHLRLPGEHRLPLHPDRGRRVQRPVLRHRRG